ncbi:MAG: hypothetical protein ACYDH6_18180 [Acidimicrobiales bacterium]
MTKFRLGATIGLAAGYYLGTRAGRVRYDQINRAVTTLRRHSATVEHAVTTIGRARAVVDLSRERVHDAVDHAPLAIAR